MAYQEPDLLDQLGFISGMATVGAAGYAVYNHRKGAKAIYDNRLERATELKDSVKGASAVKPTSIFNPITQGLIFENDVQKQFKILSVQEAIDQLEYQGMGEHIGAVNRIKRYAGNDFRLQGVFEGDNLVSFNAIMSPEKGGATVHFDRLTVNGKYTYGKINSVRNVTGRIVLFDDNNIERVVSKASDVLNSANQLSFNEADVMIKMNQFNKTGTSVFNDTESILHRLMRYEKPYLRPNNLEEKIISRRITPLMLNTEGNYTELNLTRSQELITSYYENIQKAAGGNGYVGHGFVGNKAAAIGIVNSPTEQNVIEEVTRGRIKSPGRKPTSQAFTRTASINDARLSSSVFPDTHIIKVPTLKDIRSKNYNGPSLLDKMLKSGIFSGNVPIAPIEHTEGYIASKGFSNALAKTPSSISLSMKNMEDVPGFAMLSDKMVIANALDGKLDANSLQKLNAVLREAGVDLNQVKAQLGDPMQNRNAMAPILNKIRNVYKPAEDGGLSSIGKSWVDARHSAMEQIVNSGEGSAEYVATTAKYFGKNGNLRLSGKIGSGPVGTKMARVNGVNEYLTSIERGFGGHIKLNTVIDSETNKLFFEIKGTKREDTRFAKGIAKKHFMLNNYINHGQTGTIESRRARVFNAIDNNNKKELTSIFAETVNMDREFFRKVFTPSGSRYHTGLSFFNNDNMIIASMEKVGEIVKANDPVALTANALENLNEAVVSTPDVDVKKQLMELKSDVESLDGDHEKILQTMFGEIDPETNYHTGGRIGEIFGDNKIRRNFLFGPFYGESGLTFGNYALESSQYMMGFGKKMNSSPQLIDLVRTFVGDENANQIYNSVDKTAMYEAFSSYAGVIDPRYTKYMPEDSVVLDIADLNSKQIDTLLESRQKAAELAQHMVGNSVKMSNKTKIFIQSNNDITRELLGTTLIPLPSNVNDPSISNMSKIYLNGSQVSIGNQLDTDTSKLLKGLAYGGNLDELKDIATQYKNTVSSMLVNKEALMRGPIKNSFIHLAETKGGFLSTIDEYEKKLGSDTYNALLEKHQIGGDALKNSDYLEMNSKNFNEVLEMSDFKGKTYEDLLREKAANKVFIGGGRPPYSSVQGISAARAINSEAIMRDFMEASGFSDDAINDAVAGKFGSHRSGGVRVLEDRVFLSPTLAGKSLTDNDLDPFHGWVPQGKARDEMEAVYEAARKDDIINNMTLEPKMGFKTKGGIPEIKYSPLMDDIKLAYASSKIGQATNVLHPYLGVLGGISQVEINGNNAKKYQQYLMTLLREDVIMKTGSGGVDDMIEILGSSNNDIIADYLDKLELPANAQPLRAAALKEEPELFMKIAKQRAEIVKSDAFASIENVFRRQGASFDDVGDMFAKLEKILHGGKSSSATQEMLMEVMSAVQGTSRSASAKAELNMISDGIQGLWKNKTVRYLGLGAIGASIMLRPADSNIKSQEVREESRPKRKQIPSTVEPIDPTVGRVVKPGPQGYKLALRGQMPNGVNSATFRAHMADMGLGTTGSIINRQPGVDSQYVSDLQNENRINSWN